MDAETDENRSAAPAGRGLFGILHPGPHGLAGPTAGMGGPGLWAGRQCRSKTPLWVTPTMTKSGMTAELSGSLTDVHREGLVPEGIKGTQLLVSSGLLVQRSVASLGCIHRLTDLLSQLTDAAPLPLLLTDTPQ